MRLHDWAPSRARATVAIEPATARGRTATVLALTAIAVVLVLVAFVRGHTLVAEDFGDSHDGRNGGTWVAGAEAFAESPLDSRFGARRLDGTTYANHPPGILFTTTVFRGVLGDAPASARAASIIATLAAAGLLVRLLLRSGFSRGETLLGLAAFASVPMLRVYGSMVDTPVLALPVAVALLSVALAMREERPSWRHVAVFAVAPLLAWQLVFLGGLIALNVARRDRRSAIELAAALMTGVLLTAGWLLWVHGSIGPVLDQLLVRTSVSGGSQEGLTGAAQMQSLALRTLVGPALLFVAMAAVACVGSKARIRAVAVLSLLAVFGYDVVLSNGAANHDYWGYWIVIVVAVGAASTPGVVAQMFRDRGLPTGSPRRVAVAIGVLAVVAALVTTPRQVPRMRSGVEAATVLRAVELPPDQQAVWVLARLEPPVAWIAQASPHATKPLSDAELVAEIEAGRTHHLVLVDTACWATGLACDRLPFDRDHPTERRFLLLTIGDLRT